jgi:hypothetical protein
MKQPHKPRLKVVPPIGDLAAMIKSAPQPDPNWETAERIFKTLIDGIGALHHNQKTLVSALRDLDDRVIRLETKTERKTQQ